MKKAQFWKAGLSVGFIALFITVPVFASAASAGKGTISTFSVQAYTGANVSNDGWTWKTGSVWSDVRNASSSDFVHNADDGYLGFGRVSATWWNNSFNIERTHLVFDTTALPTAAIIDSAKLVINVGDGQFASGTSGLYLVSSSQNGAFSTLDTYATVGEVDLGHVIVPAIGTYEINVNSTGLTSINRGGVTKLALRSWHDFNNVTPNSLVVTDGDSLYVTTAESSTNLGPRLVVNWHVPKGGKGGEKGEGRDDDKKGKRGNHH